MASAANTSKSNPEDVSFRKAIVAEFDEYKYRLDETFGRYRENMEQALAVMQTQLNNMLAQLTLASKTQQLTTRRLDHLEATIDDQSIRSRLTALETRAHARYRVRAVQHNCAFASLQDCSDANISTTVPLHAPHGTILLCFWLKIQGQTHIELQQSDNATIQPVIMNLSEGEHQLWVPWSDDYRAQLKVRIVRLSEAHTVSIKCTTALIQSYNTR